MSCSPPRALITAVSPGQCRHTHIKKGTAGLNNFTGPKGGKEMEDSLPPGVKRKGGWQQGIQESLRMPTPRERVRNGFLIMCLMLYDINLLERKTCFNQAHSLFQQHPAPRFLSIFTVTQKLSRQSRSKFKESDRRSSLNQTRYNYRFLTRIFHVSVSPWGEI